MAETDLSSRSWSRWAAPVAVGVPLLLLYLRTGARDIGTIDSGELATVCARFGIAHPTGYPLYTMLGRLAVMIWPGPPIVAVTLLSSLIAVAAAVAMAALVREVAPRLPLWCSWAAGWWLGCDRVFWNQGTGNEVYALHLLFVVLLVRQGVRLMRPGAGARDLLPTAYLLGLAFAHHLSSVFLLPALAAALGFYVARPGAPRGPAAPRVLLSCLGLALLAWSVVLVLPVRSLRHPILDWGEPHVWDRFWRHVMASQYRVWMFESGSLWAANLGHYLVSLPGRLWAPVLLLALAGIWRLARTEGRLLLFLALVCIVTMFWAASYDIHDIETYFLPADLVLVMLAALGAGWLAEAAAVRSRTLVPAFGIAAALLAAGQLAVHFRDADRSRDHFIRAHAEAVLGSLPPRAILLTRHWDALVSATFYLQAIERFRRDVTVVDVELLRRSWDYPQLRRWDPELLKPMEDRVSRFLQQVTLFERGERYDPAVIEGAYQAVIQGIAQLHRPDRPTAFTPDVKADFLLRAVPVPEGLAFILRDNADSGPLAPPDVDHLLRAGYDPDDDIHRQVIEAWASMVTARIRYLQALKRDAEIPPWQGALDKLTPLLKK